MFILNNILNITKIANTLKDLRQRYLQFSFSYSFLESLGGKI